MGACLSSRSIFFRGQNSRIRDDRAQDCHGMLTRALSKFKHARDVGGINITLNLDGHHHDVNTAPLLRFVIGNRKGDDLLSGRKGVNSLKMKGLCRD